MLCRSNLSNGLHVVCAAFFIACLSLTGFISNTASAQYLFNFSFHPQGTLGIVALDHPTDWYSQPEYDSSELQNFACNVPGVAHLNTRCSANNIDLTPFFNEIVVIDGVEYIHQIIGTVDSGFAQEYYIPKSSLRKFCPSAGTTGACGSGDFLDKNPLTHISNGISSPRQIVMKQILSEDIDGSSFDYIVLKDNLVTKPLIQQALTSAELTYTFESDMRHISYDENITAPVNINFTLADPWLAQYANWNSNDARHHKWDTATGHNFNATSGNYFYDETTEQYVYTTGDFAFDPTVTNDIDVYSRYFDPSQNTGCDPTDRNDVVCIRQAR